MKRFCLLFSISILPVIAPAQTLQQALKLTDNEQFDEATRVYKELIQGQYKNGEYYFWLGENYFKQNAIDSANHYFEKGIDVQPENGLNYVGLGKMQWYEGKFNGAKVNFDKALAMTKNRDVTVLTRIADCYIQADKKELDLALTLLAQAEKIDPKNAEVKLLMGDAMQEKGEGSKAIEYYKQAQQMNQKSVKAILRQGQLYGKAKNYSLAFEYYQNAAEIDSSFAPAYREQAELYYMARQYERAKAKYRRFLELSSNNKEARSRYAKFLFLSKDYPEAINQIGMIFKEDTSDNVLNRIMAFSYSEIGEAALSLSYSNRFFMRAPSEKTKILSDDYMYQGRILTKNGKDSLGLASLIKAVAMDTSKVELYGDIATTYFKMKKNGEAIKYFNLKLATKKGITVNDYYNLGKCYFFEKNYTEADTCFGSVVAMQPKVGNGYLWKAKVNANLDPETSKGLAKPWYEKYIEKGLENVEKNSKDLIEAYSYLGYFYFAKKDNVNSKLYWTKVKELDPANEKANKALQAIK
jgi:tetratricopeptide (TPR) repeat protein